MPFSRFPEIFAKHKNQLILVFSIIALIWLLQTSHLIRLVGYDQIPNTNSVLDEYTNVWHGLSIRKTGVPAAWSDLRTYWDFWPNYKSDTKNKNLSVNGFNISPNPSWFPIRNFSELSIYTTEFDFGNGPRQTSLMQPYLDHPPFGAIILSLLVPSSKKTFSQITPADMRITSIWIADITTILIFLLGLQLSKKPLIGLMSAAIYSSVPTFLFVSRLALLENVLIPIQLLSLNFLVFALNQDRSRTNLYRCILLFSGLTAGLAFLSKTTGIAVILAEMIILFLNRVSLKNISYFLIPALLISAIYPIWGFILAPNIFPSLLLELSNKRIFVGSLSFISSLFKFGWKGFPIDGWWFGGFISLTFVKYKKQTAPLLISAFVMLFVILFTGASSFPWYFIPMIPFMSIATAYLFWEVAFNPKLIQILVVFLFFFSSTYFWAQGVYSAAPNFINHQQQFLIYKILLVIFFGGVALAGFLCKRNKILRVLWITAIFLSIYILIKWNFKSIFYIIQHWGKLIDNYSPYWQL